MCGISLVAIFVMWASATTARFSKLVTKRETFHANKQTVGHPITARCCDTHSKGLRLSSAIGVAPEVILFHAVGHDQRLNCCDQCHIISSELALESKRNARCNKDGSEKAACAAKPVV